MLSRMVSASLFILSLVTGSGDLDSTSEDSRDSRIIEEDVVWRVGDYQIKPPGDLKVFNINPSGIKLANLTGKSLLLLTDNAKIFEDRAEKGCYINLVDNTDFIGMSARDYYQVLVGLTLQTPVHPDNYYREVEITGGNRGVVNFLQEGEDTSSILTWVEGDRVYSLTIKSQNVAISEEVIEGLFKSLDRDRLNAQDIIFRTPFSELVRMPIREVLLASF